MIPNKIMIRLKAEMAKLQSYWDEVSDLLFIFDEDGTIIKVSASVERVLGYTPHEIEGHKYLEYIHPNDVCASLEAADAHSSTGFRVMIVRNRYRTKDGNYIWFVWYAVKSGKRWHTIARYVSAA